MSAEQGFFDRQHRPVELHPTVRRLEIEASRDHENGLIYSANQSNNDEQSLIEIRARLEAQASQPQSGITKPSLPDRPHTFKEMFEPNEGDSALQRLAKWWVKPRGNPETTIKVLEALQIHQFQKLPKILARRATRDLGRHQSTYTVKDSRLSSLIDYAANQSAFNEAMHIGAIAATNIPFGILALSTHNEVCLAIQGGLTAWNMVCILAQRYSRARCERIIDRSLTRGKTIDNYEYNNRLNLRLPQ